MKAGIDSILLIIFILFFIISICRSSSKGYDYHSAQFDPEGRLIQLEYAKKAVREYGGLMFAAKSKHGIVLYSSSKSGKPSKLVLNSLSQKVVQLHDRLLLSTSGLALDSMLVQRQAKEWTAEYHKKFLSPIPIEKLCSQLSDLLHVQTTRSARPCGVKVLLAGLDEDRAENGEFQYKIVSLEPEGAYFSWKAIAIGRNEDSVNEKLIDILNNNDEFERRDVSQVIQTLKENVLSSSDGNEYDKIDWRTSQVW